MIWFYENIHDMISLIRLYLGVSANGEKLSKWPIDVGHGHYLVYSSKSSIFEECIIVFQVWVYKQMLSFFEECIVVFQAPAQFPKNKDVSNTTLQ